MMRPSIVHLALTLLVAMTLAACDGSAGAPSVESELVPAGRSQPTERQASPPEQSDGPQGTVTLAFAGDMHFQLHLAALLESWSPGLGPMSRVLASADVAMVNLESAITDRGTLEQKELEVPEERYYFRAPASALDFLAAAGVDVVTMANNHGADYGPQGLADSLHAQRSGPVTVLGIGADATQAFAPYRVTVRDTELAFLAADASFREGSSSVWEAGPATPGIAAARSGRPRELLRAVREVDRTADVVVVYLHWGREGQGCPTAMQRTAAAALATAGADVVVGSHAHVLLGSGWWGDTYVNYGLGNFLWYHDREPATGVLRLRIEDGEVVGDGWVPAEIQLWGRPMPVTGEARERAVEAWERRRGCADLAPAPGAPPSTFEATVHRIGPALRERMRSTHGGRCPLGWSDLRLLRLRHVGFDGLSRTGELVVAARYARDLVGVFERLYDADWPIRRMRTLDAYGGSDVRSMAANNTSGYNCRRVQGSDNWSAHALGAAIDLNPRQNPYLTDSSVQPSQGRRFAGIDRAPGAVVPPGAIRADNVVVRAFARIGWEWGGTWADPDFQHFAVP